MMGMYGTKSNYEGKLLENIAISDFFNREGIDKWVQEQVAQLKKEGKPFKFDENFSYKMSQVIEQLADRSPMTLE